MARRLYSRKEVEALACRDWFLRIVICDVGEKVFLMKLSTPFSTDGYSGKRFFARISIFGVKLFKIGDGMNRSGIDHDLMMHFGMSKKAARNGMRISMRRNRVNIVARELTLLLLRGYDSLPRGLQKKLKKIDNKE